MQQIIKADKTGNFKIPRKLKTSLKLKKDDSVFVFSSRDAIVIKKITQGTPNDRFKEISDKVSDKFKKQGITKADISRAVQWSRE